MRAIRVAYETRPFVVDPAASRQPEAPLVFEKKVETKTSAGDMPSAAKPLGRKGNIQGPRSSSKGDIEQGFRDAPACKNLSS